MSTFTSIKKYKGVIEDKRGYWIANIKYENKNIYLGSFKSSEDAALAYDTAVKQLYGVNDFSLFNFKDKVSEIPDKFIYKRDGRVLGELPNNKNKKNSINKLGYGVKRTSCGGYYSVFVYKGEHYYLGRFEDPVEAAKARDKKILELGARNKLNFPEFDYSNYTPKKAADLSSSKYRGVSYDSIQKKWLARITIGKKTKYIGGFDNQESAAQAYDDMATKLLGSKARLNFKKAVIKINV